MHTKFNEPNWFQAVSVYRKGSDEQLEVFTIEQVWDRSLTGHRRLRDQCVARVEKLRDSTGLDYLMWSPIALGGARIPERDKVIITIG